MIKKRKSIEPDCSFCDAKDNRLLIKVPAPWPPKKAPDTFICSECIMVCVHLFAEKKIEQIGETRPN